MRWTSFLIKRQGCCFRDHVHYGLFMGTKILNTFIAEPPKDLGKIKLMGSRMHRVNGVRIQGRYQRRCWIFLAIYFLQPIHANLRWPWIVQCIVTEEMNRELLLEFTKNEVQVALNQMAPLKAPGPDSMPPFLISIIGNWLVRISRHLFYLS